LLSFRHQATIELPCALTILLCNISRDHRSTATVAELEVGLELLSSIVDLDLNAADHEDKATAPICSSTGTTTTIEFLSPTGNVPLLGLDLVDVDLAYVSESISGTKEDETCSGRGLCDETTGSCTCFPGFGSSDGQGKKGTLDDCGYVIPIFRCEDGSLEC